MGNAFSLFRRQAFQLAIAPPVDDADILVVDSEEEGDYEPDSPKHHSSQLDPTECISSAEFTKSSDHDDPQHPQPLLDHATDEQETLTDISSVDGCHSDHSALIPPLDHNGSLGNDCSRSAISFTSRTPHMFGLVIGINDYVNCRKLHGAVADASAIKTYLEQVFRVPENYIRTLFDRDATRSAIISAFQDLRNDKRIQRGDAIVVFYAGHGSELAAPRPWGQEGKIQCLVPQDYGVSDAHPIPDRTIGALLENIAKEKGDNISVIFDCCHSASGTRLHDESYVSRAVDLDTTIPDGLDRDIWASRAGTVPPGFTYHGLRSHVLLAACGEKELAFEHQGRGRFTTALLEVLAGCTTDDLTYAEVLTRIHLDMQNPHCEGFNRHRVIFDAKVLIGRHARYAFRGGGGDKYVIGAGLAHGVSEGAEFTLYDNRKLSMGVVMADAASIIGDFETTVTTSVHLDASFAKLTRVGNLAVYVPPGENVAGILKEISLQTDVNGTVHPNIRVVEEIGGAKLALTMEDNVAVLKVLDRQLERFGLTELSFKIPPDELVHSLSAAAHYYWYLDLKKRNSHTGIKDRVSVDFYLLRESESEYDDYGVPFLVPVEPSLCNRDPNPEATDLVDFYVDPDGLYGIKITNKTMQDLYLNAFLFNNSSLSIAPYYTQSSAGNPEAPLKQNSAFTIGYGPGGAPPFAYSVANGRDVDVGYLKIFCSTRPIDLTDVVQPSPFLDTNARSWVDEDARKARLNSLPVATSRTSADTWFTLDMPVVQRRRLAIPTTVLPEVESPSSGWAWDVHGLLDPDSDVEDG